MATEVAGTRERLADKQQEITQAEQHAAELERNLEQAAVDGANTREIRAALREATDGLWDLQAQARALQAELSSETETERRRGLWARLAALYEADVRFLEHHVKIVRLREQLAKAETEMRAAVGADLDYRRPKLEALLRDGLADLIPEGPHGRGARPQVAELKTSAEVAAELERRRQLAAEARQEAGDDD